jgi:uncharacterized protein YyaL (SSP411 family)
MERESFEKQEVADVLNADFVSIKGLSISRQFVPNNSAVDREERPDIDQIYMTFVTAISGHGGWPLNVFLTPDLEPIFGGTYFAGPETAGIGRPGFLQVLENITRLWKNDQDKVKASGKHIIDQLRGFVYSFPFIRFDGELDIQREGGWGFGCQEFGVGVEVLYSTI